MNLPNNGVVRITGDADKPANRAVIAEDGTVTLSRAWSAEELATLDRIEALLMKQGEALDRIAAASPNAELTDANRTEK